MSHVGSECNVANWQSDIDVTIATTVVGFTGLVAEGNVLPYHWLSLFLVDIYEQSRRLHYDARHESPTDMLVRLHRSHKAQSVGE